MTPIKRMKITKEKQIRYSLATYTQKDGAHICDLEEVAKKISKWEFPEKLNFTKSSEIVLLAREYLIYREMEKQKLKKRKKK